MTAGRPDVAVGVRAQRRVRAVAGMLDHRSNQQALKYAFVVAVGVALLILSVADLVVVLGVLM